jgi:hypothetical protein
MGVVCAVDVIVLISLAAIRPVARFAAFLIAAAWASVIFAIGAMGGFGPGVTGPFPSPVIAFLILMIGGLIAFFDWPSFRNALLSLPLTALVGINACRIGGVGFLILHNQGRLAAPFATSAGWGDIITGLAAIPLAFHGLARKIAPRSAHYLERFRRARSDRRDYARCTIGAGDTVPDFHRSSRHAGDGNPSMGGDSNIAGTALPDDTSHSRHAPAFTVNHHGARD